MNSTLEKATQAAPATIEQEIAEQSRALAIPKTQLRRICTRAGLDALRRGELKARTLRPDQRSLTVTLVIETHVALQKLASQKGRSVNDLVIEVLTKAANKAELTSGDFEAMAVEVQAAEDARAAIADGKTTIELDADAAAKIRASLRAIKSEETIGEFVTETLNDMLGPNNGFFEGLIQRQHEHRRGEIEAKLARIREGDKRLVRPEPMPRNAIIHQRLMERLEAIAAVAGSGVNSALNGLLETAMSQFESGALKLTPNTGGAAE